MNIGEILHTRAEREAAPVGAVIRHNCVGGSSWTKVGPNLWTSSAGGSRDNARSGWLNNSHPDGYVVEAWPGAADLDYAGLLALGVGERFCSTSQPEVVWEVHPGGVMRLGDEAQVMVDLSVFEGPANAGHLTTVAETPVAVPLPAVGELVADRVQFHDLPVGTVLRSGAGVERTKGADGRWFSTIRGPRPSDSMRLNYYRVVSVPEVLPYPSVGERIETFEQVLALPLGTVISSGDNEWTKTTYGWMHRGGAVDPTRAPIPDTAIILDGYNTVVSLPGEVPVVQGVGLTMASNTTVTFPIEGTIATETIAMTEHHRIMAEQVAHAIDQRNEEFLTALREAWDGVNFNEREINEVLSDLGIEGEVGPGTEEVSVMVDVNGRSTLGSADVEGLFEGRLSASVDDTRVSWDIDDIEFGPYEVSHGACACSMVDRHDISTRLDESGVSYDSFEWEASCPNC
jgi:hypothetical protein